LDQSFNSLHAQREACEAYILSQKHEGWTCIPTEYDDGGFSGGSMNRPSVKALLKDVEAGLVDTIVVYKVDRLTRSLADFAKMVELFDRKSASFVSVTQAFNTTTSMGRLTLNVLLSFAQFERELTGERIRDKIAASKAKGMWMGGVPPLGYGSENRTLVAKQDEAEQVRSLFKLYRQLRSADLVVAEAQKLGISGKRHVSASGRVWGGGRLLRGAIYRILQNPVYAGKIPHGEKVYQGVHMPIVEQSLFDEVQQLISTNRRRHKLAVGAAHPSLLVGLLYDADGRKLASTHSCKGKRRYRYYVGSDPCGRVRRYPGARIEKAVVQQLASFLSSPQRLSCALVGREAEFKKLVPHAQEQAAILGNRSGSALRDAITQLVDRVELRESHFRVLLKAEALLGIGGVVLEFAAKIARRTKGLALIVSGEDGSGPDPAMVALLSQGRCWLEELATGRASSIKAIAHSHGVTQRYVGRLIELGMLSPVLVERFFAGGLGHMTAAQLKNGPSLPLSWTAQQDQLQGREQAFIA